MRLETPFQSMDRQKVILRSFVTTYATLTKQVCRVRKQSTQLHNNGMEVRTDLDIN